MGKLRSHRPRDRRRPCSDQTSWSIQGKTYWLEAMFADRADAHQYIDDNQGGPGWGRGCFRYRYGTTICYPGECGGGYGVWCRQEVDKPPIQESGRGGIYSRGWTPRAIRPPADRTIPSFSAGEYRAARDQALRGRPAPEEYVHKPYRARPQSERGEKSISIMDGALSPSPALPLWAQGALVTAGAALTLFILLNLES